MVPLFGFFFLLPLLVSSITTEANGKRQILVDGQPFFAKGVAYSAIQTSPNGRHPLDNTNRAIWEKDLQYLQQLGANLIRLYDGDVFRKYDGVDTFDQFFAQCEALKIRVILQLVVPNGLNLADTSVQSTYSGRMADMVQANKERSCVFGFAVGNEMNFHYSSAGLPVLKSFVQAVVAAGKSVDSGHIFTFPVADINLNALLPVFDSLVDVWAVQSYRGGSFFGLFDDFKAASAKPLLITEYGIDSWDTVANKENEGTQASYVLNLAREIHDNAVSNNGVTSGGCVFEFSDEWWKAGSPKMHNAGGGANKNFPDGQMDEEYFGLVSTQPGTNGLPDDHRPKLVYTALKDAWTKGFPVSPEQNSLLTNGGFSLGTTGWIFSPPPPTNRFSHSVGPNGLSFTQIKTGANQYEIQLIQELKRPLSAGLKYTLSFTASAQVPRDINSYVNKIKDAKWPPLSDNAGFFVAKATTTPQSFSFTFVSPESVDARLVFEFGAGSSAGFTLKDVLLVPASQPPPTPASQPGEDTEQKIVNGNFSNPFAPPWTFHQECDGTSASLAVTEGQLFVSKITPFAGKEVRNWCLRISQTPKPLLQAGRTYYLSFDARADSPRTIFFYVGSPKWPPVGGESNYRTALLTTETQHFHLEIVNDPSVQPKVIVEFGMSDVPFYLDHVSLENPELRFAPMGVDPDDPAVPVISSAGRVPVLCSSCLCAFAYMWVLLFT